MSDSSSNSKKETEMERIARLAREFREQETKRIAAEKEAAQLEAQRKKEEELRQIASSSEQTLEEGERERRLARLSRLSMMAMTKEELLQMEEDPHVAEKARLLLERELEEEARRTSPAKGTSPKRRTRESYIKNNDGGEDEGFVSGDDESRIIPDATSPTSRKLEFEGVDVSGEARRLLEKEEAERRRLEEEANLLNLRNSISPSTSEKGVVPEVSTTISDDDGLAPAVSTVISGDDGLSGVEVSGEAKRLSEKEEAELKRREEEEKLKKDARTVIVPPTSEPEAIDSAAISEGESTKDSEELRTSGMFGSAATMARNFVFGSVVETSEAPIDNSKSVTSKVVAEAATMEAKEGATTSYEEEEFSDAVQEEVAPKLVSETAVSEEAGIQSLEKNIKAAKVAAEAGKGRGESAPEKSTKESVESKSQVTTTEQKAVAAQLSKATPAEFTSRVATETTGVQISTRDLPLQEMDEQYIQTLVLRRRDHTAGMERRKRKKGSSDGEDNDHVGEESGRKEATFEFPIEWTPDGKFKVLRDTEVTMSTHIPPSRVNGRWSGTLEGKSTIGRTSNSNATGSMTLDYKASPWSRLSLGLIRGHELFHPMISLGGSLIRDGSTVGVTFFHNASFLHAMLLEHSMYALYFRHHVPKSSWIISSELSRKQELSLAVTNSKISGRAACNLKKPDQIDLRLDVRPRISEDRRAHLYCQWKLGVWQLGASLVQSLHSHVATVGLGVRIVSTRGLEWMLSWNRGNATVRIPIIVSRGLQNVDITQFVYYSFLSFLLEEAIADLWGWKASSDEATDKEEAKPVQEAAKKSRENAELQRKLMERQAKRKKRTEAEKDGLVIDEATYKVKGGDEWDVAIPLQFWVTNSSLTLAATSKSQLLGFYDLTDKSTKKKDTSDAPAGSSWRATLDDLFDLKSATADKSSSHGPSPTLTVKYQFKGQAYSMSIADTAELQLPNPKATRL